MRFRRPKLFNMNFVLFWIGQFISKIGDNIYEIGLMWLVYKFTGSTLAMGATLIVYMSPALLFGLFAGVFADRYNKRKILIISDLIRGLILLTVPLLAVTNTLNLFIILAVTFILSSIAVFFNPTANAILPHIVLKKHIINANSSLSTSTQIAGIIGPAVGGVLVAGFGPMVTIYINSISFIISAIFIGITRIKLNHKKTAKPDEKKFNFSNDVVEGLKFIYYNRKVRIGMIIAFLLNMSFGPLNIVIPTFSEKILHAGPKGFGLLGASLSLGALLGAIIINYIYKVFSKSTLTFMGLFVLGLSFGIIGVYNNLVCDMFLLALGGLSLNIISIVIVTSLQTESPSTLLDRVFSSFSMIVTLAVPIGAAVASVLLSSIKSSTFFIISGVFIIFVSLVYLVLISIKPAANTNAELT